MLVRVEEKGKQRIKETGIRINFVKIRQDKKMMSKDELITFEQFHLIVYL